MARKPKKINQRTKITCDDCGEQVQSFGLRSAHLSVCKGRGNRRKKKDSPPP